MSVCVYCECCARLDAKKFGNVFAYVVYAVSCEAGDGVEILKNRQGGDAQFQLATVVVYRWLCGRIDAGRQPDRTKK